PYFPTASCAGWPQFMMSELEEMALCNLAHSGMTTNCFRDDGHWKIIQDRIKKGDVILFQFGHNDQKRRNLQAFSGYMQNLRRYVNETLSFGAYPILVTPISRIPFEDNGEYRSILLNHALAVKLVADEYNIPYIDMHEMTFDFWTNDIDKAHLYFMPGDITHTNDFGAILLADMASKKIQADKIEPLYSHLKYKPLAEDFFEVAENSRKEKIPAEKASNVFDIEVPYIDMDKAKCKDGIVKAFRYGLLDPCVMYIHPEDFMPKAQVLMVLFKALRLSGKRPYLYHFVDISKYEWDSSYVQTCIDEDLLDKSLFPGDMFYPDSPLTEKEFASLAIRGMHNKEERNKLSVSDCLKEAREKGILSENENTSDEDSKMGNYIITREECYTALAKIVELAGKKNEALPKDAELHPSL
ncbi:MAG: hypothetical protein K6F69_03560, partial [Treponema sp.]|nr:hypothetical protein [Treponema sp.]